nr:Chain C, Protein Nef [Human immunodeficiency virus 1]
NYTPGPGIRF